MIPSPLLLALALGGCAALGDGKTAQPDGNGSGDDSGDPDSGDPDTGEATADGGAWAALALEGADGELAGSSVAWVGDVDDDGGGDFLVGAPGYNDGDGAVYLVHGQWRGRVALAGFPRVTEGAGGAVGYAMAAAGDTDGDGSLDILVGAPRAETADGNRGSVYLLRGPIRVDASLAAAVRLDGGGEDARVGASMSAAGDFDGDGTADLAIAADGMVAHAYLVPGATAGDSALADSPGIVSGELITQGFWQLASVGDTDGDGIEDLLIGAPSMSHQLGQAYLFHLPVRGEVSVTTADAVITGESFYDRFGQGVAGGRDIDGDGAADLLIGAPGYDPLRWTYSAGGAYLFPGSVSGEVRCDTARAMIVGDSPYGDLGWSVAMPGDLDADGVEDVAVGAPDAASSYFNGATYLFSGTQMSGTLTYSEAQKWLVGHGDGDALGATMSGRGDMDGDASPDLLIGTNPTRSGDPDGRAYVYLGGEM